MNFSERMNDIQKLKKDPNFGLLWCRHGNWLIEQAEKVERLESELDKWKKAYHKLDPVGFIFNEPLKED